jgi:hypothetical protein
LCFCLGIIQLYNHFFLKFNNSSSFFFLIKVEIPWKDMEWHAIKTKLHDDENSLPVDLNLIPFPFNRILRDGLSYNSIKRMSFEEVKTNLDNFREVNILELFCFN